VSDFLAELNNYSIRPNEQDVGGREQKSTLLVGLMHGCMRR